MAKTTPTYAFFLVPIPKIAVMNLCTLGFYNVYWFYKQWQAVKAAEHSEIFPLPRAIFTIFFVIPLFKKMQLNYLPGILVLFGLLWLSVRLPKPFWLINYLLFIPLMLVQQQINSRQPEPVTAPYSLKAKVAVALGAVLFVIIVAGAFTPIHR